MIGFSPKTPAKRGLVATLILAVGVSGCVTIPPVRPEAVAGQDELTAHVKFLAQPALKGRSPGTRGSHLARRYIENWFSACHLVPWAKEHGYELPFGSGVYAGRNVVGVLPGSDPHLASELVLVSAHYDHLGKDNKGRICPGAADNASGVAALLETAKQIGLHGPRPKRSICFVAFDCEEKMLFGSFSFACRHDVIDTKIAAVINVDMLGRNFLDVVQNTLFVAGAENYPEIRAEARQMGTENGIRVFTVGTDLVGPRGDHAAFESRPIPCLFFSCGPFKDYHEWTDTADKLDYAELSRSANTISATVRTLADGRSFPATADTGHAQIEELQSVKTVMSEVLTNCPQAGIKPEAAKAFTNLVHEADSLLQNGNYTRAKRAEFIVGATGILAPNLLPFDDLSGGKSSQQDEESAQALQFLQQFYINHRGELMEGYHRLVAHILKYRPGPFRGMPRFEYEVDDTPDEDIRFSERSDGQFSLDALAMPMWLNAETKRTKWLFESFRFGISSTFVTIDTTGTREQLADLCLLYLRAEQHNALHVRYLKRLLKVVTGAEPQGRYAEILADRLRRGHFNSEAEWIAACVQSGNPELALEALATDTHDKNGTIGTAVRRIIQSNAVRSDVRAQAVERARPKGNRATLLALCAVVNDATPASTKESWPTLRDDYPFADRLQIRTLRPFLERQAKQAPEASKSIGDLALAELRKATGKDFGKDKIQWRRWIEDNVRPSQPVQESKYNAGDDPLATF